MTIEELKNAFQGLSYEVMFYREEILKKENLSFSGYFILSYLEKRGPSKPSEIAAKFGITKPSVSHIVDLLAGRKFVERAYDPSDRRTTYITLTDEGRKLLQRLNNISPIYEKAFDGCDSEFQEKLVSIIEKLSDFIHELRSGVIDDGRTGLQSKIR